MCVRIEMKLKERTFFILGAWSSGKYALGLLMGDNCTNVASQRLIEKLALKTSPHPRPYKLQWLSENRELVVDRQILICFSIGKYVDEILFDVVLMEASHLLL